MRMDGVSCLTCAVAPVTPLTLSSAAKATLFGIMSWRCWAQSEHGIARPRTVLDALCRARYEIPPEVTRPVHRLASQQKHPGSVEGADRDCARPRPGQSPAGEASPPERRNCWGAQGRRMQISGADCHGERL